MEDMKLGLRFLPRVFYSGPGFPPGPKALLFDRGGAGGARGLGSSVPSSRMLPPRDPRIEGGGSTRDMEQSAHEQVGSNLCRIPTEHHPPRRSSDFSDRNTIAKPSFFSSSRLFLRARLLRRLHAAAAPSYLLHALLLYGQACVRAAAGAASRQNILAPLNISRLYGNAYDGRTARAPGERKMRTGKKRRLKANERVGVGRDDRSSSLACEYQITCA